MRFALLTAVVITAIGLGVAACSDARWAAPIGGAIVGLGVAGMHYIGMWAFEIPGHVTWSMDLVATSILIGMLFGMAALALAIRDDRLGVLDHGRRAADAGHRFASLHRDGRGFDHSGPSPLRQ